MQYGDASMWADIVKFHKTFNIPQLVVPAVGNDEMMQFREKFLEEELQEFKDAVMRGDRVKAFDALIDLVYVAMGTAYICNFPWQEGWDIVQTANMRKVRAEKKEDSTRGTTFDVVKPEGFVPPDKALSALLEMHEFMSLGGKLPDRVAIRERFL